MNTSKTTRVHDFAKQAGLPSKAVLEYAQRLFGKAAIKSHASILTEGQIQQLTEFTTALLAEPHKAATCKWKAGSDFQQQQLFSRTKGRSGRTYKQIVLSTMQRLSEFAHNHRRGTIILLASELENIVRESLGPALLNYTKSNVNKLSANYGQPHPFPFSYAIRRFLSEVGKVPLFKSDKIGGTFDGACRHNRPILDQQDADTHINVGIAFIDNFLESFSVSIPVCDIHQDAAFVWECKNVLHARPGDSIDVHCPIGHGLVFKHFVTNPLEFR